jgi:hypothetical protein
MQKVSNFLIHSATLLCTKHYNGFPRIDRHEKALSLDLSCVCAHNMCAWTHKERSFCSLTGAEMLHEEQDI